jgi:hypothetical protein
MWQRCCTLLGGLLLVGGLLLALHLNHVEAMAVSARPALGQGNPHKRPGNNAPEYRWLERQEGAFKLALAATALGVIAQTFAAAFPN